MGRTGPHHHTPVRRSALSAPLSHPARVVVLASGTGTLLKALTAAAVDEYPARIVGVGVDRDCEAARFSRETFTVCLADYPDRAAWDVALTSSTASRRPDLIVCAGFMRILGPTFLAEFGGRIINTHPALLPSFPGARAVPDALAYGVKVSGTTVHLVDSGVDTGPILAQEAVPVLDGDDASTLHERIKIVERRLLIDVIAALASRGVTTDGRKAQIPQ